MGYWNLQPIIDILIYCIIVYWIYQLLTQLFS